MIFFERAVDRPVKTMFLVRDAWVPPSKKRKTKFQIHFLGSIDKVSICASTVGVVLELEIESLRTVSSNLKAEASVNKILSLL